MNKTTIYRRWPSRAELVVAALTSSRARPMRRRRGGSSRSARPLHERDDAPRDTRRSRRRQRPDCRARRSGSGPRARELRERHRAPARRVLEHARRRGDIPKRADIELLLDVLTGAIYGRLRECPAPARSRVGPAGGPSRPVRCGQRPRQRAQLSDRFMTSPDEATSDRGANCSLCCCAAPSSAALPAIERRRRRGTAAAAAERSRWSPSRPSAWRSRASGSRRSTATSTRRSGRRSRAISSPRLPRRRDGPQGPGAVRDRSPPVRGGARRRRRRSWPRPGPTRPAPSATCSATRRSPKERAIAQSQLDNDVQASSPRRRPSRSAQAAVEAAELNLGFTKVRSLDRRHRGDRHARRSAISSARRRC